MALQTVVVVPVRAEVCPVASAGIYTEEQVAGWKPVVKAVKDKGASFFCQVGACTLTHLPPLLPLLLRLLRAFSGCLLLPLLATHSRHGLLSLRCVQGSPSLCSLPADLHPPV